MAALPRAAAPEDQEGMTGMDAVRFDHLARLVDGTGSRRRTLAALTLGFLGLSGLHGAAEAGPGCKDVGKRCKRGAQCCSGICKGKHGRKRCRAHDTGGCRPGHSGLICGEPNPVACTTSTGKPGLCFTTTGNAGYCGSGVSCVTCSRDDDCRALFGDDRAACAVCASCSGSQITTVCLVPG
jgi:hypothetical protein